PARHPDSGAAAPTACGRRVSAGVDALPLYFDHAATTPVDAQVAAAMAECLTQEGTFGNPSSQHWYGRQARERIELSRSEVARLVGAAAGDVLFTSGATESNNLAILGSVRSLGRRVHVVTVRTEHRSVLDACGQLEREGHVVSYLEPDTQGLIDATQLEAALRAETALVSIMHANNETGVLQDVAALGAVCRRHAVALHVDAAQSAGKVPIDVGALGVDLLSFTAHKLYGPKGIGALVASAAQRAILQPLLFGGGQERGIRSGTLAVHQIVGFAVACQIATDELPRQAERLTRLTAMLWQGLADLPGVLRNGHATRRVPGLLNVSFEGVDGESLLAGLSELALSSGSACDSDSDEPSHVLRSLGRSRELAQSSLRFSLGRGTDEEQIRRAVAAVRREVLRLRAVAP
ncbi:MAG TPA: aminotransferase class V-fold PLP-dependent enzyme, partial [Polyangiaceae bacterium]|nr:aminotransferase class V-fold PLP-dependent enzyme [Polyangiaceae bacterium]